MTVWKFSFFTLNVKNRGVHILKRFFRLWTHVIKLKPGTRRNKLLETNHIPMHVFVYLFA